MNLNPFVEVNLASGGKFFLDLEKRPVLLRAGNLDEIINEIKKLLSQACKTYHLYSFLLKVLGPDFIAICSDNYDYYFEILLDEIYGERTFYAIVGIFAEVLTEEKKQYIEKRKKELFVEL